MERYGILPILPMEMVELKRYTDGEDLSTVIM